MIHQTKLTLRLDKKLIQQAKAYSQTTGQSLSQIVASYFALLENKNSSKKQMIGPITRALQGSLRGSNIKEDDYHRFLEDKYL